MASLHALFHIFTCVSVVYKNLFSMEGLPQAVPLWMVHDFLGITHCIIVFSYFICILSQTLFLQISLLLGSLRNMFNIIIVLTCIVFICRFYVHYLWYCLYVYLLIVCIYYFYLWVLCIIILWYCLRIFIYLFIYWKSGTSDLLVLILFVLQCIDYK